MLDCPEVAQRLGADRVIDYKSVDPVEEIMHITGERGVDVAIEALVTHRFGLDEIEEAYDLFANQRDGVFKVAITP